MDHIDKVAVFPEAEQVTLQMYRPDKTERKQFSGSQSDAALGKMCDELAKLRKELEALKQQSTKSVTFRQATPFGSRSNSRGNSQERYNPTNNTRENFQQQQPFSNQMHYRSGHPQGPSTERQTRGDYNGQRGNSRDRNDRRSSHEQNNQRHDYNGQRNTSRDRNNRGQSLERSNQRYNSRDRGQRQNSRDRGNYQSQTQFTTEDEDPKNWDHPLFQLEGAHNQ